MIFDFLPIFLSIDCTWIQSLVSLFDSSIKCLENCFAYLNLSIDIEKICETLDDFLTRGVCATTTACTHHGLLWLIVYHTFSLTHWSWTTHWRLIHWRLVHRSLVHWRRNVSLWWKLLVETRLIHHWWSCHLKTVNNNCNLPSC